MQLSKNLLSKNIPLASFCIGLLSCLLLPVELSASDNAIQDTQNGLNLMQHFAESGAVVSEESCVALEKYLDDENASSESLRSYLSAVYSERCQSISDRDFAVYDFSSHELRNVAVDALTIKDNDYWLSQPYCAENRDTFLCSYDHEKGKGGFIMGVPGQAFPRTYLVCAYVNSKSANFIASGQTTRAKCRLSEAFWSSYIRYPAGPTKPYFNWLETDYIGEPQKAPIALKGVCESAFRSAYFCNPQLIVEPTVSSKEVKLCSLQTSRTSFNLLGLIKVKQGSSRWTCERIDFDSHVLDKNMTVAERRCSEYRGPSTLDRCMLPWIPYRSWGQ